MRRALKITLEEFASAFQRARPPTGWGKTIAVAYSGGVDSTCLLHLLHQHLQKNQGSPSLLAIHVDHSFRPTSQQHAEHCRQWTQSRSIPSVITKIPWQSPLFSSLRVTDRNKEEMARIARYRMLFDIMKEKEANVLLMAHHLDDQVETAIMRHRRSQRDESRGANAAIGLAGMRYCRRWGMGRSPDDGVWYYGLEGMSRWISRPLLDFPKSRIQATAQEEKLDFVEDETNADAKLTERNAIRATMHDLEPFVPLNWPYNPVQPQRTVSRPAHPSLVECVREYGVLRDDVDKAVDEYLARNTETSPPGTYHIITSREPPPPPIVRIGIILRILRYVSPLPWGSPQAEAHRDSEQLNRIAKELWPFKHSQGWKLYTASGMFEARSKFCGGSFVLWQPTPYLGAPTTPQLNSIDPRRPKEKTYGWIAIRQPPSRNTSVSVDVFDKLDTKKPFSVLWDNRWLVEFDENALDRLMKRLRKGLDCRPDWEPNQMFLTAEDQWYQPCIKDDIRNVTIASTYRERANPSVKMSFIRPIDVI